MKKFAVKLLAFQITWILLFFVGIFWHNPVRISVMDENSWYYINRGYPISWAGVSRPELAVPFPLIKAPGLGPAVRGDVYHKIIDLSVFVPLFLSVFFITYGLMLVVIKALNLENKWLKQRRVIFWVSLVVLLAGCVYFYFGWFPRI